MTITITKLPSGEFRLEVAQDRACHIETTPSLLGALRRVLAQFWGKNAYITIRARRTT